MAVLALVEDLQRDGHLPLPERRRVRELFGDPGYRTEDRTPGRRRRFALHRACVERVLPVWRAARPDGHRPDRMVELAQELMDGTISRDATRSEWEHFDVDLNAHSMDLGGRVYGAGQASAALIAAGGDYGDETPLEDDDHDLDPDSLEASFLGSIAVASLSGESDDDDPQARREYWRWYLEEAVPAAYRAAEDE